MSEENTNVVSPGVYDGRVANYGMRATKKGGAPEPVIAFKVNVDGKERVVYWRGSLKEGKAREITIEALLTCGLSTKNLAALADGPQSGALDCEKELSLTVINEANEENGNLYAKVQYVNSAAGTLRNTISKQEAVQKLSIFKSLQADILNIAKKRGYKLDGAASAPKDNYQSFGNEAPPPHDAADIPF